MAANAPESDATIIDVDGTELVHTELVHEHERTTVELVPAAPQGGALMRPVASLEETVKAFHAYQELRAELLDPSDFQEAERGKQFVTKSGWRKMAVAMSVSDELVGWEDVEDSFGRVRRSKVTVRALAPNGRYADGIGICDYRERCCPKAFGEPCRKGGRHRHCPDDCTGFDHFSKPQHDIPSTAHTRAKNRALSDLFGFGEVTAEEVSRGGNADGVADDGPATGEQVAAIVAGMNGITDPGQRRGIKLAFVQRFGQPHELLASQVDAAIRLVQSGGGTVADPTVTPGASSSGTSADGNDGPPAESSGPAGDGPPGDTHVGHAGTSGPSPDTSSTSGEPPPPPGGDVGAEAAKESTPPPARSHAAPAVTGGGAAPDAAKPSDARQRQTIGIRMADLAGKELVRQGDKPEIVAILTGERTTTTTEMSHDEANKMISTLAFIESGDLCVADDPDQEGARTLGALTQRGADFLAPIVRDFQPAVPEPII